MNICKCGCEKECAKTYSKGHSGSKFQIGNSAWKNRKTSGRPKIHFATNLCLCGCGRLSKTKYFSRECWVNARKQDAANKPIKHCLCGCGTVVKNKYVNISHKPIEESTRQKMRDNRRTRVTTEETRQKYAFRMRGNHLALGYKHTDKTISKIMSKNSGHKRFTYIKPDMTIMKMRSKWEVAFASYLDALRYDWEYEPKQFVLNDNTMYYPDFYIKSLDLWIELKGYMWEAALKKIEDFRQIYPNEKLILLQKRDLEKLGVLPIIQKANA